MTAVGLFSAAGKAVVLRKSSRADRLSYAGDAARSFW
jgi:hypothetical protein